MNKIQVELFSDEINYMIVKTPDRNFPGMVIQGDSLRHLHRSAEQIYKLSKSTSNEELEEIAEMLLDDLDERIRFYEQVLASHDHELPYILRTPK